MKVITDSTRVQLSDLLANDTPPQLLMCQYESYLLDRVTRLSEKLQPDPVNVVIKAAQPAPQFK